MSNLTRRNFLQGTLAAAATVTIAGTKSSGRVLGSNETIRVAVAGLNGRGASHVDEFARMKGVEVVTLIDPDTRTYAGRIKQVDKLGGKKPKTVQDVRKALEDKDVDVISIATPNHWHSLMAIWACQAGKDVYVEKPCSHNLWEGKQLVSAAQRYNRIVQHGTQGRSATTIREAIEKVRDGTIGETYMGRGLCYKWRDTIGKTPVQPIPQGVDYNLWTGPAP